MIKNSSQAPEQNDWQEFKPLFGSRKIKLRDTLRAVTPCGGLSVRIEFFRRIGLAEQLQERRLYQPKSPNHYIRCWRFWRKPKEPALSARRPIAVQDLRDICDFISRENPVDARRMGEELIKQAEAMALFPQSGRMAPEKQDPLIMEIFR